MPNVGPLEAIVVLVLLALAIPWLLLPFSIFRTKSKLDELIAETRRTNAELEKLRQRLASGGSK